jgi:glutamate/tyrosine decarboxylase-like PLP-dependent enzyme
MISDDCNKAEALYHAADAHPDIEAFTLGLSIATFRFVPHDLTPGAPEVEQYLNSLNEALLRRLKTGGELFVTNAVLDGRFLLRACIVNFRTTIADAESIPGIVAREGRALDAELRSEKLPSPVAG